MLTAEQIAAMTPAERGELIRRLARPTDELRPARWFMRRMREFRVVLMVGSVVVLVPWIAYLAVTLPRVYVDTTGTRRGSASTSCCWSCW